MKIHRIWLCRVHARAADSKDSKFTAEELREWKRLTNMDLLRSVMHNVSYGPGMQAPTPDEVRIASARQRPPIWRCSGTQRNGQAPLSHLH